MKIASNEYRYSDGDVPLTGFLVRPDDVPEQPAPAVLLVHGGAGLDEHARTQATRYAALGYIVFACACSTRKSQATVGGTSSR